MTIPIKWEAFSSRGSLLTTQLDALAAGSRSAVSTELDNATSLDQYAKAELTVDFVSAPTAGGFVSLYAVTAPDGTNYEDGSDTVDPGTRRWLCDIPVRADTAAQRLTSPIFPLEPAKTKLLLVNNTDQPFPASDSVLKLFTANDAAAIDASHVVQGRLTLTTGVPITTTDVTAAGTLYFTPYNGNTATVWDGTSWKQYAFTELSLSLSGATSGKPYDVFMHVDSGTPALEKLVWTDDTTRATGVTIQDGRYCKTGDKTRLYLGTLYTTGTGTTEDSEANRFLWNMYNQASRYSMILESTSSWTKSSGAGGTGTWSQVNSSSANRVRLMMGLATPIQARADHTGANQDNWIMTGIGIDSTTTPSGTHPFSQNRASGGLVNAVGYYSGVVAVGMHAINWLEFAGPSQTPDYYSNSLSAQSGMSLSVVM